MTRSIKAAGMSVVTLMLAVSAVSARELSIDERVTAQKAIEQVYWNHRIWPKENPGAKPPLSAVMSDQAIRAKVDDYLRKSNALERFWQRPVTSEQLQAELDRMAKNTRDGATLQELFGALGNDPFVIAETLGRQTVVERLIRNWYANDTRFHGDVKKKAEAALAACTNVECMKAIDGKYNETTWKLRAERAVEAAEPEREQAVLLEAEAWTDHVGRLAAVFGTATDAISVRRLSGLEEDGEQFIVTAVLSERAGELTTASVTWPKRSFDAWWDAERIGIGSETDLPSGTFTLPNAPVATCTNDSWTTTRFEVPDPRDDHAAVWTGTEMIVWGGSYRGVYLDTGSRYNPATDTWSATSTGTNAPQFRSDHTIVWTGTEMVVWGGSAGWHTAVNTGGRYNPSTDTWRLTSTGPGVPASRADHTAVWTGSEMIVWGGAIPGFSSLNTGGRYSPSADSWVATSTGANVPSARNSHSATWTGTEMIVWGGAQGAGVNTGGRYNPSSNSWSPTSTGASVPSARYQHTVVWTGTRMIVWGGVNGPELNDGSYDPLTDSWNATSTGPNVPVPRAEHTAVWTGTQMIVWGGWGSGIKLGTGGRYDPGADSWTATPSGANAPGGRRNHTAVWTGSEMIVWGGNGVNTGGRYNPSTNSWAATSTGSSLPSARYAHTAVWTGTEMVVWGGAGAFIYTQTGGRYTPSTDTWTPTSAGSGAPSGRISHTATWTGTEMIVWGGYDGVTLLNTGGRYNPLTDTWLATPNGLNQPTVRQEHTAVWTGTELIVWGGNNGQDHNTGGRFNPATGIWSATSRTNVPQERTSHTAVWTGTEMVVWGGAVGVSSVNTGGRYSPANDSWITTATGLGLPSRRMDHTAIWTGTEMVVWGGRPDTNSAAVSTGGRYNPTNGTWTAMSTGASLPSARYQQTAVWTGTEMIVWGGYNGSSLFNSGGRYRPSTDTWAATATDAPAPPARVLHSALWTGTEMVVWGGYPDTASGGRYCACLDGVLAYRDVDGDGYGNPSAPTGILCGPTPPGYAALAGDCNDGNSNQNPGVPETCNGIDDNCDGAEDGPLETLGLGWAAGAKTALQWTATANAIGYATYEGGTATMRDLLTTTGDSCIVAATTGPSTGNVLTTTPAAGQLLWYLVRPLDACGTGTSGSATAGVRIQNDFCDDGNACTMDRCDATSGCVHTDTTSTCDDGDACTTGDVCAGGVCAGTIPPGANHLVISQIQTAGDGANAGSDEFIEIYNPTSSPVSLSNWSLQLATIGSFGSFSVESQNLSGTIPAHGWFLVAPFFYNGPVIKDQTAGLIMLGGSKGNVLLVNSISDVTSCSSGLIVDKVTYGSGSSCAEGVAAPAPSANNSILRLPGGACGDGTDTNSNSTDFVLQTPSTPRNSTSPPQP